MRMRWQEIPKHDFGDDADATTGHSHSGDATGQLELFQPDQPHTYHTHRQFGTAGLTACSGNSQVGMNWRERRDMPWIIAIAVVVILLVLIGVYLT